MLGAARCQTYITDDLRAERHGDGGGDPVVAWREVDDGILKRRAVALYSAPCAVCHSRFDGLSVVLFRGKMSVKVQLGVVEVNTAKSFDGIEEEVLTAVLSPLAP